MAHTRNSRGWTYREPELLGGDLRAILASNSNVFGSNLAIEIFV